ncbi:MAG: LacI family DNA-binding transcriptional regulator [Lachnospiraceae bacterium]|nr:LacI family DNA-binding transcriptional regulator [Lachnospiraceae bacterium]
MNIYDIAKMANVSIATVSRVVNGSDKVSEKTREKVLKVIDEVGYTPNVFAQGLGLNTMHTVGVLVPTIADSYMANAVAHLESELFRNGYDCILSCSGFELEGKQAQTDMLLSKHIDTLIYVGSTYAGDGRNSKATDYIREAARQVPVFIINGHVSGDNIYSSVCEDEEAVYEATKLLLDHGRKKLLFLTDSHSYSANKKKKGFEKAMREAGASPSSRILYVENNIHAVRDLLFERKEKCDAVIASNDEIAVGAVKYAAESGLKIPKDMEIIGYNNSLISTSSTPELSSMDNHTAEICHDTVERFVKILSGKGARLSRKISVSCTLVLRETTLKE